MNTKLTSSFFYLGSTLIFLFCIFPFLWAFITSLKSGSELFSSSFMPRHFAWKNYAAVFTEQPFAMNILNSTVVASAATIISIYVGVFAAYPLSKRQFKGRNALLYTFLAVSMFPQIAVLSGLFEILRALGIYNSWAGLTLSYLIFTVPFTTWILTSFMREIPKSLEEAALLDGASVIKIIFNIFLPIMAPAIVTTFLLSFIAAWNEFLFALTFTFSNRARTVPVAMSLMSGASSHELPWANLMAASVTVTLPLLVLVIIFQKRIVAGITTGAVKG